MYLGFNRWAVKNFSKAVGKQRRELKASVRSLHHSWIKQDFQNWFQGSGLAVKQLEASLQHQGTNPCQNRTSCTELLCTDAMKVKAVDLVLSQHCIRGSTMKSRIKDNWIACVSQRWELIYTVKIALWRGATRREWEALSIAQSCSCAEFVQERGEKGILPYTHHLHCSSKMQYLGGKQKERRHKWQSGFWTALTLDGKGLWWAGLQQTGRLAHQGSSHPSVGGPAGRAQKGKTPLQQQKGYQELVWWLEALCPKYKIKTTSPQSHISMLHSPLDLLHFHRGGLSTTVLNPWSLRVWRGEIISF